MVNSYSSFCDDFYLDMCINTELELPSQRDTILAFFERIQKQYPSMGCFYKSENGECCIEEDRQSGQYRWVTMDADRICSGIANPSNFEEVYSQDEFILDIVPYMLGVNHLDFDSLDVSYIMDFDCAGNHDEVISEALFGSTPFNCLLDLPDSKAVGFSPSVVVSLSEDSCTQARISVESKTSVYEQGSSKQKRQSDEAITLSFTLRQYPSTSEKFDALKSFRNQCRLAEEIMASRIMPNFVKPLNSVITQRRLT